MKTVLFHREFLRFQGGHLKVWQYFNHVRSAPGHRAVVRFRPDSVWDEDESLATGPRGGVALGRARRRRHPVRRRPGLALAGPADRRVPCPSSTCFSTCCTHRRTTRSGGGASSPTRRSGSAPAPRSQRRSTGTGVVRGPVFAIPNAIDLDEIGRCPAGPRDIDLLVLATKQAPLGRGWRSAWRSRAGSSTWCAARCNPLGAARADGSCPRDAVPAQPAGGLLHTGARGHGARHGGGLPRQRRKPLLLPRRGELPHARIRGRSDHGGGDPGPGRSTTGSAR